MLLFPAALPPSPLIPLVLESPPLHLHKHKGHGTRHSKESPANGSRQWGRCCTSIPSWSPHALQRSLLAAPQPMAVERGAGSDFLPHVPRYRWTHLTRAKQHKNALIDPPHGRLRGQQGHCRACSRQPWPPDLHLSRLLMQPLLCSAPLLQLKLCHVVADWE